LQLLLAGLELDDVVLPSEEAELEELELSACAAAVIATASAAAQNADGFIPFSRASDRAAEAAQSVESTLFQSLIQSLSFF
jgi:hypothetical protein